MQDCADVQSLYPLIRQAANEYAEKAETDGINTPVQSVIFRTISVATLAYEGVGVLLRAAYAIGVGPGAISLPMLLARVSFRNGNDGASQSVLNSPVAALLFVLRFTEWYREQKAAAPPAQAPPAPRDWPDAVGTPCEEPGICHLCGKSLSTSPVAALPSGRAFCYYCIERYIAIHGQCPVTHIHYKTSDIRPVVL